MKSTWIPALLVVSVLVVAAGCGGGGSSCPSCLPPIDPPPIDPPPIDPPDPTYDNHDEYFAVNDYVDATTCTQSGCHPDADNQLMATVHWNWEGSPNAIEGDQGDEIHGKTDLLNNFCISIPSNEGRCTQCHVGYGWVDKSFDHSDNTAIDCLICHDQTGTYAKAKPNGGMPIPDIDLQEIARSTDKGEPGRRNCLECHAKAGGGDNVKHGDLSVALYTATFENDVHMDVDGFNMSCQTCHESEDHEISGQGLHWPSEGRADCTDCHGGDSVHEDRGANPTYDSHLDKIACQTCHIPTFARVNATKTWWDWSTAGDMDRVPENDPVTGKPDYDKMKGDFEWGLNVVPTVLWYNHMWNRKVIGQNDTWSGDEPVVLAAPSADINTVGAKLYPFKAMRGKQPADVVNQRIISPHLFGTAGGPNPYWGTWDWDLALQDGANYTDVPFTSGDGGFVETVMYLTINHEVAPAGLARRCTDCHFGGDFLDWEALGYPGDPALN